MRYGTGELRSLGDGASECVQVFRAPGAAAWTSRHKARLTAAEDRTLSERWVDGQWKAGWSLRTFIELAEIGGSLGGRVPRATWQNFPTDLVHFLSYFVAHEAHHRGQLVLIARRLGRRLPRVVTGGVWQWIRFSREQRDNGNRPRRRGIDPG